jgi:hypothetical protein
MRMTYSFYQSNAYLRFMKTLLSVSVLFSLFTLCGSCSPDTGKTGSGNPPEDKTLKNAYISGKVTEVRLGKDGYTAKLITEDKQVYFATISRANLKENASQYRTIKPGEKIRVKGDTFSIGEETHVTVRELKR